MSTSPENFTMDRPPDRAWDITPVLLGVPWMLTSVAIVAVATRFVLQRKLSLHYGADDWTMFIALFLQIILQVLITKGCSAGAGTSPAPGKPMPQILDMLKWSWYTNPISTILSVLTRISAAIFLVHVFGVRTWFKWFIVAYSTILVIVGLACVSVVWWPTHPILSHDLRFFTIEWDLGLQQTCWIALQVLLSASDLIYVIFPVAFVWKLKMPTRRKVILIMLLALSTITFIVSVLKLVVLIDALQKSDINNLVYALALILVFTSTEQALVIIIGTIPKLRSITTLKPTIASYKGLFGNWSKGSPENSSSTPYPTRVGYADLEMQPRHLQSEAVHGVTTFAMHDRSTYTSGDQVPTNHILRTDNFSVSISEQRGAVEGGRL
ncbi:hypothetical protein F4804DRAFT_231923 [Jackrogersella minutella]|nr:hypothetical protein F4804DRAFT_231923 [Jackrogersella minutella]